MQRSLRPSEAGVTHRDGTYDDASDLIEDCLVVLAQRRAKYLGDDLAAVDLLASFIDTAVQALADRVGSARAHGYGWLDIASALSTSPAEARMHFEQMTPKERAWLHGMS
jgi:hypothetical protein